MKKCPQCGVEYPDTNTLCPADGVALEKTDDSLIGTTARPKSAMAVCVKINRFVCHRKGSQ